MRDITEVASVGHCVCFGMRHRHRKEFRVTHKFLAGVFDCLVNSTTDKSNTGRRAYFDVVANDGFEVLEEHPSRDFQEAGRNTSLLPETRSCCT